jgi:hypothetical protein
LSRRLLIRTPNRERCAATGLCGSPEPTRPSFT